MINGVKFVSIPVRDQDRALGFYTTKLGTRDHRQPVRRYAALDRARFSAADTEVVLFASSEHEMSIGSAMSITFVAEDVMATAAELKAKGVEFIQEAQQTGWGTAAIFKDSEGNQFVLSTP